MHILNYRQHLNFDGPPVIILKLLVTFRNPTFAVQLMSATFLVLNRTERNMVKNVISPYSCHILIDLVFSRRIFERYSNIKFHENPTSESRVVPC